MYNNHTIIISPQVFSSNFAEICSSSSVKKFYLSDG
ncbi:hypothetical protein SAMN05216175_1087 [Neptunomonas qingdaonensis]|uniref:Uncharacterized protein n=1 Tax=Neptunomonas qingdaonensis TaxID=1045558 RepID=A0A1I2SGZ6_9GAMM|nr:hypothetical protein SAMN05216175_1087 [Neptunomonas qingdaonensis]